MEPYFQGFWLSFIFFLIIFFKEERNPKLCPLDYLVHFLHLNFKIFFLNEQLSRFPLGQLPVGVPLVTFWLWTLLPFSFCKYSVLVPSQSHAGAKEITCLQMVLLGDHTECSALLFYLLVVPHVAEEKESKILTFNFLPDKFQQHPCVRFMMSAKEKTWTPDTKY